MNARVQHVKLLPLLPFTALVSRRKPPASVLQQCVRFDCEGTRLDPPFDTVRREHPPHDDHVARKDRRTRSQVRMFPKSYVAGVSGALLTAAFLTNPVTVSDSF